VDRPGDLVDAAANNRGRQHRVLSDDAFDELVAKTFGLTEATRPACHGGRVAAGSTEPP